MNNELKLLKQSAAGGLIRLFTLFLTLLYPLMATSINMSSALAEGSAIAPEEPAFTLDVGAVAGDMKLSWAQGYAPTVDRGRVTIWLPLVSECAVGEITASIRADAGVTSPFEAGNKPVMCGRKGGIYPLRLRAELVEGYFSGDYPCHIAIVGKNADGENVNWSMPIVLRLRDGIEPSVIEAISVDVDAPTLVPASQAVIAVTLTNPNAALGMYDIALKLSDDGGYIIPAHMDVLDCGALQAGESVTVEYPVMVGADTPIALRQLSVNIEYTALDKQREYARRVTVDVKQPMRLETGELSAPDAMQGELAAVSMPIMNMGRTRLCNVYVTLTIDGLGVASDEAPDGQLRQSVLLGDISAGGTTQARLSFNLPHTAATGLHTGAVLVEYEDEWQNAGSVELPVELSVLAAPVATPAPDSDAAISERLMSAPMLYALAGIIAALITALIVQGRLLRGRLRRAEEERM